LKLERELWSSIFAYEGARSIFGVANPIIFGVANPIREEVEVYLYPPLIFCSQSNDF
jgi:hypothetical protein